MPSDLNNGTAENLSLLQRGAGLLDLFQGIPVGHQLPQRELALTHPLQEKREIGLVFCGAEAPAIVALGDAQLVHLGIANTARAGARPPSPRRFASARQRRERPSKRASGASSACRWVIAGPAGC